MRNCSSAIIAASNHGRGSESQRQASRGPENLPQGLLTAMPIGADHRIKLANAVALWERGGVRGFGPSIGPRPPHPNPLPVGERECSVFATAAESHSNFRVTRWDWRYESKWSTT